MSKLDSGTVIWNKRPADFSANRWLDGFVVGGGRVGAVVTGAVARESILINHVELRDGGKTSVLQDISDKFPLVRKLYNDAKVFDAAAVMPNEFAKKGFSPSMDYQIPLCSIDLSFQAGEFPMDYSRVLDMESAEAITTFRLGTTTHTREIFASRTQDMIVFNATRSGPDKINMTAKIENARHEGSWIYFNARTTNGDEYGLVVRFVIGGNAVVTGGADGIKIADADSVMILAKPFIGNSVTEFTKIKKELEAIKLTYAKMSGANAAIHKRLFQKTRLELGGKTSDTQGTLMNQVSEGKLSGTILERLYNFAKYLSICTDGGLTPSGLWLSDARSSEVSFTNNVAQLLFGPLTLSVNPDAILQLMEVYEKYSDDLRKNASRIFGASGYFIPDKIAPGSGLVGSAHASTLHFVASGALFANLIYNYYLVTGDVKTLKSRIFPFMRNVLDFYGDFLKLGNDGTYTTMPSYSPSSTPGNTIGGKPLTNFHFATNSTIDFLSVGALLDNLVHASEVLNDKKEIELFREMRAKLPKLQANENGAIREWTNSAFTDAKSACGSLHTYGLYPFKSLSFNDYDVVYQPRVATGSGSVISLREASVAAIIQRLATSGSMQDAQTLAMFATQATHSGQATLARDIITRLLSSTFTNSGLSLSNDWRGGGFSHSEKPTLDITGNFGLASAVTECLLQSNYNTLRVLPSAFAELSVGELADFTTDFGARVTMSWDLTKGRLSIKITPKQTCQITIELPPIFKKHKTVTVTNNKIEATLTAGKTWSIEF